MGPDGEAFMEGWRTKTRLVVQICSVLRRWLSRWDAPSECGNSLNRVFFASKWPLVGRITLRRQLTYAICRIFGAGPCSTRSGMAIHIGALLGGTVS